MTDIVEQGLRIATTGYSSESQVLRYAKSSADEIERLRKLVPDQEGLEVVTDYADRMHGYTRTELQAAIAKLRGDV